MVTATQHAIQIDPKHNSLVLRYLTTESKRYQQFDLGPIDKLLTPLVEDISKSAVLYNLFDQEWISLEILYNVAQAIHVSHPQNGFNWIKIFNEFEAKVHLKNVTDKLIRESGDSVNGKAIKDEADLSKTVVDPKEIERVSKFSKFRLSTVVLKNLKRRDMIKRFWAVFEQGIDINHKGYDSQALAEQSLTRHTDSNFNTALGVFDSESNTITFVYVEGENGNYDRPYKKELIDEYILNLIHISPLDNSSETSV